MRLLEGATNRQKVLLFVLLLVLVNVAGYWYVYKARASEMSALSAQATHLQQSIRERSALAADVGKIKRERAELQAQYLKILERLPEEKEVPQLLRQMATVAGQSGLEVTAFRQKDSVDRELYREISVELVTRGAYENLWAFLNGLGRIPRIVNVVELHAKILEGPADQEGLTTSLVTTVFQSHSKEGSGGFDMPSAPPGQ